MNTFENSILVTGDVIADTDIYVGERLQASNVAVEGTVVRRVPGGASLLHQLIAKLVAGGPEDGPKVVYGFNETELGKLPAHLSAHALYGRQRGGTAKSPTKEKVWRVISALGYGTPPVDAPEPLLSPIAPAAPPTVLVLDDGGAGFRSLAASNRWPFAAVPDPARPPGRWIVLKMAKPVAQGDLWRAVSGQFGDDTKSMGFPDRLVTVVNADFLRLHEAGISRGLSWEKTVREICRELVTNVSVRPLLCSRHLLILFRHEGVLWFDTARPAADRARLIFDPDLCEGEWESTLADPSGDVLGHLTTFTAFVAAELGAKPDFDPASFESALKRGIEATRLLRLVGHESAPAAGGTREPGFPFEKIASMAIGPLPTELVTTKVPCDGKECVPDAEWTIIAHHERRSGGVHPLFGTAMQVALKGPVALKRVPHAHFSKLTSIDRDEMEALRALRRTIRRYVENSKERKPLAVAVFGPPGAGKSFGVKQIADELFAGKPCVLEFNLSQFGDPPSGLIGAFHQVRDKVLEGFVPIVFWDEFDSNEYDWLKYFLAPLQDGKFQEGQITHALSRCIFVFAGGTSRDFEHFGPAPEPRTTEELRSREKRWANRDLEMADDDRRKDFILKKGPDFVSRLDTYFNVLGPNQRQLYNFESGTWDRLDASDVGFPIRRALLLRTVLGVDCDAPLPIEPALLSVLLRVSNYRHGARSMEKIVLPLRGAPGEPLRRANLPPCSVLSHHLDDADEPDRIFAETGPYRTDENLLRVAAAVNENYLRTVEHRPPDPHYLQSFDKIDAWGKATNVAAAARLPEVLALAGLRLVLGEATADEEDAVRKQLDLHLPVLAEREHDLWMEFHTQNSWAWSSTRDKSKRRHHLLRKFEDLANEEKEKDYGAIRAYPNLARLAGYKIGFIVASS